MSKINKRKAPSDHAKDFSIGYQKKGNDGNMWEIVKTKKGVKRWKKSVSDKSKMEKSLNNKIYSWWFKLSEGQLIIIFKNNTYKFCKSNKKTANAKSKEIRRKWKEYGENKDVIGIIWSNMSIDTLHHFIYYLLFKIPKKDLDKILNMKKKDLEKYLIINYKKYFFKYEMETKKDYMFKQSEKLKTESKQNTQKKKVNNKKISKINYRQLYNDIFWGIKAKAIKKLYHKIGGVQFIIVFKDGTYKFIKPKNKKWKGNTYYDKMKEYDENDDVVAILISAPSSDALTYFIFYLLFKIPKKDLHEILNMKEKDLEKYLITNYKKYFKNEEIDSKKNYLFKYYQPTKQQEKKMQTLGNDELYKMWSKLSDGKNVIFVYKDKTYKKKRTKTPHDNKVINKGIKDNNVIAILTAGNSYDSYRELFSKAKMKDVDEVIKDYKKYFPYPFGWEDKGFIC